MSKKKDLIFKANVLVNVFEWKEDDKWNSRIADTILRNDDPSKAWKGVISISNSFFYIKSKNKTSMKKFEFKKLCGLITPDYNFNILVLGFAEEKMIYYVLRFDNMKDKEEALKTINMIKGPDKSDINNSLHTIDETYSTEHTNGTTFINEELPPNNYNFKRRQIPRIPKDNVLNEVDFPTSSNNISDHIKDSAPRRKAPNIPVEVSTFTPVIPEKSEDNHQMISGGDNSDDSDVMPGTWVEDVKYISFEPSLGKNVECDEGSVYMYTARQIVPRERYVDSYESDSD